MILKELTPNHTEVVYKNKVYSTNSKIYSYMYAPMYYNYNKPSIKEDKYSGIRTVILDDEKDVARINDILIFMNDTVTNNMDHLDTFIISAKYHYYIFNTVLNEEFSKILNDFYACYKGETVKFTPEHIKYLLYSKKSRIVKNAAQYLLYLWYWLPYTKFHILMVNVLLDKFEKTNVSEELLSFVLKNQNMDSIYNKYIAVIGGVYG